MWAVFEPFWALKKGWSFKPVIEKLNLKYLKSNNPFCIFALFGVENREVSNVTFFKNHETSKMFVFDEQICGDVCYKKHETTVEKLNALVSHVNIN